MDAQELLKQDFISMMMSRPTRTEAEELATRAVDGIADAVKEIVDTAISNHNNGYMHSEDED